MDKFLNLIECAMTTGNKGRAVDHMHTARAALSPEDFDTLCEVCAAEYNLVW